MTVASSANVTMVRRQTAIYLTGCHTAAMASALSWSLAYVKQEFPDLLTFSKSAAEITDAGGSA